MLASGNLILEILLKHCISTFIYVGIGSQFCKTIVPGIEFLITLKGWRDLITWV